LLCLLISCRDIGLFDVDLRFWLSTEHPSFLWSKEISSQFLDLLILIEAAFSATFLIKTWLFFVYGSRKASFFLAYGLFDVEILIPLLSYSIFYYC
jgi:hypothetical protein